MTFDFLNFRSYRTAIILVFTCVLLLSGSSEVLAQKKKPTSKPSTGKPAAPPKTNGAPATSGKCPGSTLTADEVNQILAAHNLDRSANNLSPLSWDCKLASMAQEWASRGVFEHRETPYGENIFVGASPSSTMNSMVGMWLAEKPFWDNKAGSCATGKTCGHYTQIVWKATTKVGCGLNRNATGKWKVMFVCNYDPSGNTTGPAF